MPVLSPMQKSAKRKARFAGKFLKPNKTLFTLHVYRFGLTCPLLDYSVKKYKGHRSLNQTIIDELQMKYDEEKVLKLNGK